MGENHQEMVTGEPAIHKNHLLLSLIPIFLAEYPVMLPHIDCITISLYILFGMTYFLLADVHILMIWCQFDKGHLAANDAIVLRKQFRC